MAIPEYVPLDQLEGVHFELLSRAVRNVLDTGIALITYAQIIDGLPVTDVAWDQHSSKYDPSHPINSHKELFPGALEKAKVFRTNFAMADVKIDLEKLNRYQETKPPSRSFYLRLIEVTVCALHQIGVRLSQQENFHDPAATAGHDVESTTNWERLLDHLCRVTPWPTMFIATQFTAHNRYPNGIDDIVGY
ncbi:hypothetical protein FOCG_06090 [Fusarium oxysporum f. sp. radicis-lycopersici 26381]|uniref:Uncharacterized protein n=1 Tax=Fusarium oxysporum f. sp. narcissi TaxID=451672 RepID=A0A4Q2VTP8_FUSOX|nr:hypothetical protein FOWG_03531 [Fusarium oxysporum f. sp. lycopersici MN25]EXL55514.1 hypothetical protein FOCG_06090 [Fusarium oxysporum f. sp. radicis-lycopersici 26381]RYC89598.1 hypothetical protein BFJ63_vAg7632 [Fusarium oxysporum f. sp. narcissi]